MATFSSSGELAAFSGALADQYEVEREIGRGGMGVVYLARDLRLDRMVAIKTLPPSLSGDQSVRERFLREARTAARLNHPNIVPIHRADEIGGQVFFVMGFIDGDSLAARIASSPLAPRDALPILRDVAGALGYAHKHGVVHRDVKTENILLDTVTGRSMVTDFGIARVAAAQPMTATGQVLGTVYYLSPEQVTDDEIDARSDIYALGVVGYMTLSGRFPFDGNLASAILVSHVLRPAPPLASVAPRVPAALTAIIDRCLAKSPADRFQSCADFIDALDRAQVDADAVAAIGPRRSSPIVSSTEAQSILGRAAELGHTGAREKPVPVKPRDAVADARRRDGFKTSVLRDAAAEAGISAAGMEQALAEHGLRSMPTRVREIEPVGMEIVHDLTRQGMFVDADNVHLQIILDGEAPESDYDLLVETIRRHFPDAGMAGVIGRTLTWKGTSPRERTLEVQVQPRAGRTTIVVRESFRKVIRPVWGIFLAVGGMAGGSMAGLAPSPPEMIAVAFGCMVVGAVFAGIFGKGYAEHRQKALRKLTDELAARARKSIDDKDKHIK